MRVFHSHLPDRRAARLVALHAASGPRTPGFALAVLERALEAHVPSSARTLPGRAPDTEADQTLRRAARFLCAEARAADPGIEPLLVALERKWLTLPAAQQLPADGRRGAVWARLVALCHEEFYAVSAECGD